MVKPSGISQLMMADYSPEKAGVGGSIPSLATNCIRHCPDSGGKVMLPVNLYTGRRSCITGVRTSLPTCFASAFLARST